MYLINPDVLADAKGLSVGATAFFLLVGITLWGFGWRWHRFWVVFAVTLTAGLWGISAGRAAGTQVLAVSVLVALAAGMLALEIAKITAFVTGGTAAWLAAQAVMPEAAELWSAFLCGGLVGVVLYRLWTMLATAFVGVLLIGHTGVLFLDMLGSVNAVEFAQKNAAAINTWAVLASLVGVLVQSWTGKAADAAGDDEEAEEKKGKKGGGKTWASVAGAWKKVAGAFAK